MKKFYSLLLIIPLFFSCVSNNNAIMKDVYAGYYAIAEEYFKLEKYAKAVEFYEKCLTDIDELTLRNVKYRLAQSYLKLSKWNDAQKIYEDLLLVDSENTNLQTLLAYTYMKLEEFDSAEKIYLSLIESQNLNQSSYKNLILLYSIKNDFEKAKNEIALYKEKFPLDETISTIETEVANQEKKYESELKKAEEALDKETTTDENTTATENTESSDEVPITNTPSEETKKEN